MADSPNISRRSSIGPGVVPSRTDVDPVKQNPLKRSQTAPAPNTRTTMSSMSPSLQARTSGSSTMAGRKASLPQSPSSTQSKGMVATARNNISYLGHQFSEGLHTLNTRVGEAVTTASEYKDAALEKASAVLGDVNGLLASVTISPESRALVMKVAAGMSEKYGAEGAEAGGKAAVEFAEKAFGMLDYLKSQGATFESLVNQYKKSKPLVGTAA